MAIVGVLAGLLLPALASARNRARQVACANNLKHIGTALHMYANDYDDYLISVQFTTPDWTYHYYWFGRWRIADRTIRRQDGSLHPYLRNAEDIEICPNFANYVPRAKTAVTSYGYNYFFLSPYVVTDPATWAGSFVPVRLTDVQQPGRTICFADAARDFNGVLEENWFLDPVEFPWGHNDYYSAHFRHNGFANVLFVDGHVKAMGPGEGPNENKLGHLGTDNSLYDLEAEMWVGK